MTVQKLVTPNQKKAEGMQAALIAQMESLLAMAKSGEIVSIAFAVVKADGELANAWSGAANTSLGYSATLLSRRFDQVVLKTMLGDQA